MKRLLQLLPFPLLAGLLVVPVHATADPPAEGGGSKTWLLPVALGLFCFTIALTACVIFLKKRKA